MEGTSALGGQLWGPATSDTSAKYTGKYGDFGFPRIFYLFGRFGAEAGPGGPGRCFKSSPEGVASISLSMGPWRATATPFVTKMTDLGHSLGARGSRNMMDD